MSSGLRSNSPAVSADPRRLGSAFVGVQRVIHKFGAFGRRQPTNVPRPVDIPGQNRRVLDDVPIEVFLDRYPPAIRDTGLRLRELIRLAVPNAVEGVRSGWSWIGYGLPDRRAKRTFAWIGPERKHIHLGLPERHPPGGSGAAPPRRGGAPEAVPLLHVRAGHRPRRRRPRRLSSERAADLARPSAAVGSAAAAQTGRPRSTAAATEPSPRCPRRTVLTGRPAAARRATSLRACRASGGRMTRPDRAAAGRSAGSTYGHDHVVEGPRHRDELRV